MVASKALQAKQQQQNVPEHHLVQYCRTHCYSIGDMFERLQEQRWEISAVLSDRNFTKLADARTLELTDGNWQIIEELLPVLQTLKCATTALSGESDVSISMVYPIITTLLSKHLRCVPGECHKVMRFKTAGYRIT